MTIDVSLGRVDDPGVPEVLATHLAHMRAITPAGSVFAFELDALAAPHVSFFTARVDGELAGCGALARLDDERGEVKSMHVRQAARGRGIASALLVHVETHARSLGLRSLWLETGVTEHFAAAQALYRSHGYEACGPFGSYTDNGHSAFFTKRLDGDLP
jgi:putative acetyltransferase